MWRAIEDPEYLKKLGMTRKQYGARIRSDQKFADLEWKRMVRRHKADIAARAIANRYRPLDQAGAEAMVAFLAGRLGVRAPALKFDEREWWAGSHDAFEGTISTHGQTGVDVVAHEFAHYLEYSEMAEGQRLELLRKAWGADRGYRAMSVKRQNDLLYHNESFYLCLRRVLDALGVTDYPWESEYENVWAWAKRDGLLTKKGD